MIGAKLDTQEIQKQLNLLSDELQEKAVKAGVAKVGNFGVKQMRSHAPSDQGDLVKAIRRKKLAKAGRNKLGISAGEVASIVGPNYKGYGRISNILEGGAKRHVITPRGESNVQRFLRSQGASLKNQQLLASNGRIFGTKINHPGVKAYHFIKRTNADMQGKATRLFYTGVRDYLRRKKLVK